MNFEPNGDESRLDQSLRDKFSDFHLDPSPGVWSGLEERLGALPPEPAPPPRLPLLPLLLVALVGLLVGLLLPRPHLAGRPATTASTTATAPLATTPRPAAGTGADTIRLAPGSLTATHSRLNGPAGTTAAPLSAPTVAGTNAAPQLQERSSGTDSAPLALTSPGHSRRERRATRQLRAALARAGRPAPERRSAYTSRREAQSAAPAGAEATSSSTFLTLGESVPASLQPLVALEKRSLTQLPALAEPAGSPDRAALLATVRAERAELARLRRHVDSLLVALGDQPQLLVTSKTLAEAAVDSTLEADSVPGPLTHRWSILLTATPEQGLFAPNRATSDTLTLLRRRHETSRPGVNVAVMAEYRVTERLSVGAGLGYRTYGTDLRLTDRRTQTSLTYDTVQQVVTPRIVSREVTTYRDLQPDYHFLTLPTSVRYRLTPAGSRWWADVAGGAQLQLFLGGTQLVSADGRSFVSEGVGLGEGPFRPLSLALSGSLALNYGLTPRLSMNLAPTLRWQATSVFKSETGLRQDPLAAGLQLGLRWRL